MKCKRCGNEFEPNKPQQEYCSAVCRNRDNCRRYYWNNLEKNRSRCLSKYWEYKKTRHDALRRINLKAKAIRRFGEERETILERFKHRCVFCGRGDKRLLIHHLDGIGRGFKNPNNSQENKVACCYSCHIRIHVYHQKLEMKI